MTAVKIGGEIHRFFVYAAEHVHCQLRETALRVAIGGRAVPGRAEVAVRIHQHVAQAEVLTHAHQSVIHRAVAVGVVFGYHIADHRGALHMTPVGAQAVLGHRPEDAAVNRLEAVAGIGQGA